MAHITGGGLPGNLNRALPRRSTPSSTRRAGRSRTSSSSWSEAGGVARAEMFRTFNMGVGMVVICRAVRRERGVVGSAARPDVQRWRLGRRHARLRPGHSHLRRLIDESSCVCSFAAIALAATSAVLRVSTHSAARRAPCGPLTSRPGAVATQDACQQAIDVFQYMAPQLGARHRRRQRDAGPGRYARRPRALLGRPARQRCSAASLPQIQDVSPSVSGAQSTRFEASDPDHSRLPTADAGDRHLQGLSARADERRRHRSAGERGVHPRRSTRTTSSVKVPDELAQDSATARASACCRSRS